MKDRNQKQLNRPHLKLFHISLFICLSGLFFASDTLYAASIETDTGVIGYDDTPKLSWCEYLVHDPHRPLPVYVNPGPSMEPAPAPSDAIVLFDGKDLSKWQKNSWQLVDNHAQSGKGPLKTKQSFGNFQLHLEFMTPADTSGNFWNRGNNGLYIMGYYEVQIFDSHPSHKKKIYPDGQCAAIYGQTPPLVNACRKPGQWQTYDIIFIAPVFENDKLVKPAMITMLHNNILVHLNTTVHGPTGHRQIKKYKPHPTKLPLVFSAHNSPVRFRNIWVRPLPE